MLKNTKRIVAGGLVIAAAAAPSAAQAMPASEFAKTAGPAQTSARGALDPASDPGFPWGAVAIGAGGTAVLLAAGGVTRRRRTQRALAG